METFNSFFFRIGKSDGLISDQQNYINIPSKLICFSYYNGINILLIIFPVFLLSLCFFSSIRHAFGCQSFRHNSVTERVLTMPFSRMGRGVVRPATCMSPCARILVSKPRGHILASQTVTFIKGKAFNKIAVISKAPTILCCFLFCYFGEHSPNPYNLPTSVLSYLTY